MSDQGSVKILSGPRSGQTIQKDHEKGLVDSIKGLIAEHASAPGGTDSSGKMRSVDQAVDDAVNGAPGNTTDY